MAATAAEKDCPFDPRMHAGEDAVRTGMYICICMHTRRVREVRVARVSIRVVASSGLLACGKSRDINHSQVLGHLMAVHSGIISGIILVFWT